MSETQRSYRTRQYILVLEYLSSHEGEHVTVDVICEALHARGHQIGRTTVYRQLEKMVTQGLAARYSTPGVQSACYQYVSPDCTPHRHYHLKCSCCGALIHCECEFLDKMTAHIEASHSFLIDPAAMVLYGTCSDCKGGEGA